MNKSVALCIVKAKFLWLSNKFLTSSFFSTSDILSINFFSPLVSASSKAFLTVWISLLRSSSVALGLSNLSVKNAAVPESNVPSRLPMNSLIALALSSPGFISRISLALSNNCLFFSRLPESRPFIVSSSAIVFCIFCLLPIISLRSWVSNIFSYSAFSAGLSSNN